MQTAERKRGGAVVCTLAGEIGCWATTRCCTLAPASESGLRECFTGRLRERT